jgi:DNA polymerase III subunit delta
MAKKASSGGGKGAVSASTRVLVLTGRERFLADEYLRQLREALTDSLGADGFDTLKYDGLAMGGRSVADVLDECRSVGLMQQHKVVVVDNADALLKGDDEESAAPAAPAPAGRRVRAGKTNRELFESYAEEPSESATLVLRAAVWRPGKLDKKIEALGPGRGALLSCDEQPFEKLVSWAVQRCEKRHNSTIPPAAAARLVEAVGSDLGRIDQELEKLAVAAGGEGRPITAELVGELVESTRQEAFWAIQGRLLAGDAAAALEKLRELVEVSRHDAVPLTWTYVDTARKLYLASEALAGGAGPGQIAGPLKLWGELMNTLPATARRIGPERLAELLLEAVDVDSAGKSGLGDPVRNLERLTVEFGRVLGRG